MSLEEWIVYKHTSPSCKSYYGITKQKAENRWRDGKGYKGNKRFWNAIQKYGWENFTHEILYTGLTQAEAEKKEKELVKENGTTDKRKGYNVAEGGHALSAESRKKIGDTRRERGIKPPNTGKHLSEETKGKISATAMGNHYHTEWTEEERKRLSEQRKGIGNPNYNKPMPEKTKAILIASHERAVVMIKGDASEWFKSAKDASKKTGIYASNIGRACKNKHMTAGGYKWRYADEMGRVTPL